MKHKFFAYSPDCGFESHPTAEAAQAAAQTMIDDCRDAMDDGWDAELVEGICWGEVSQFAKEVRLPGWQGCDYELQEAVK
ncbi:MAG: hypothetical protein ACRCXB_23040 [Aeromonadaceae bacterium]